MTRDVTMAKISKQFEKTAREKYPYQSMYEITKKLNDLLVESLINEKHNIKKKIKKKR